MVPFLPPTKRRRGEEEAGPSGAEAGPSGSYTADFSDDDDDDEEEKVDREELLRTIDKDIQRLIEEGKKIDKKEEKLKDSFVVNVKGELDHYFTIYQDYLKCKCCSLVKFF